MIFLQTEHTQRFGRWSDSRNTDRLFLLVMFCGLCFLAAVTWLLFG